ncbi:uncharacterized protein LOC124899513 [Capsicum annuum]|uniref:uncharacterized protein LOC124899513 n=1 Tax=Capsicum annuum TaxID=4072 RepID=UPI001FB10219|nr:uncharacterized protein LOC124899513 [Capsicum annuum]
MVDCRTSMTKFLAGVSGYVVKECRSAMLNRDIDLSTVMIHAQQIKVDKFQRHSLMPTPSSASNSAFRIRPKQGSRPIMSRSQDSVSNRPHSPGASSSTAGGQRQNHFYAIPPHLEQENSPDVVTGTLCVSHFDIYVLMEPG